MLASNPEPKEFGWAHGPFVLLPIGVGPGPEGEFQFSIRSINCMKSLPCWDPWRSETTDGTCCLSHPRGESGPLIGVLPGCIVTVSDELVLNLSVSVPSVSKLLAVTVKTTVP